MKQILMVTLFFGLSLAGSLPCQAAETTKPTLDRTARERLITGANQALRKHMTSRPNGSEATLIAKEHWGEAITSLKPLRVLNDKINVFIVLKDDATSEEGVYVSIPISSYAPGMDKRFLKFEKISESGDKDFGALYWCKIEKTPPPKAPKTATPPR